MRNLNEIIERVEELVKKVKIFKDVDIHNLTFIDYDGRFCEGGVYCGWAFKGLIEFESRPYILNCTNGHRTTFNNIWEIEEVENSYRELHNIFEELEDNFGIDSLTGYDFDDIVEEIKNQSGLKLAEELESTLKVNTVGKAKKLKI